MRARCAGCQGGVVEEAGRCYLPPGSMAVRWLCRSCQVGKPDSRLYSPTHTPERSIERIDPDAFAPDPRDVLDSQQSISGGGA